MKKNFPAFLFGIIFALGLGIAGMTQPQKVIGFLDIFGNWNPSLMWVMVGAIAVHGLTYRLLIKRSSPILTATFQIPTRKDIDFKLIFGAVLFGIGWGISGFCPAPAITSLVALDPNTYVFVSSMIFAMALFRFSKRPSNHPVTNAN
jgi:uncharacterized membrane protein YedE/YeeE